MRRVHLARRTPIRGPDGLRHTRIGVNLRVILVTVPEEHMIIGRRFIACFRPEINIG